MAQEKFNINSLLGQQIQNPFSQREDYVTITGVDPVKQTYTGKTKSGQTFSSAIGGIDVEAQRAAPSSTAGVVSAKNFRQPSDLTQPIQETQVSTTDALGEWSMPTGEGMPVRKEPTAEDLYTDYRKGQAILSGVKFVADVLKANAAFSTIEGQAQLNILQARNQGADAIYRGRQAQMDRQSEGYQQGQNALLAMAAQGQDVGGAGVQKIQASIEAMGIFNGMKEEINSMREALGFELEEINYDYQVNQARNEKNAAILGSALNLGANVAGVYYGV
jgi:hypothetical protein